MDEQCFAAPHEVDTDNSTYRQAMSGPEPEEWEASNDREIDDLARHGAFEEVSEDTLPTWDEQRQRASEVINILWVLMKKYIDGVFKMYKSRAVFDGAEQKKMQLVGVLECFAPTGRHSTHKLLVAHMSGMGMSTTISLDAYVDRLANKYLSKNLKEYSRHETPSARSLSKKYEDALVRRHQVDQELLKTYLRKFGALIYTGPACRVDCAHTIGMLAR